MKAAALALPLIAAACAGGGTRYAWVNPGADAAQQSYDLSYCQGAAEYGASTAYKDTPFHIRANARRHWEACMRERGYSLQPAPPGVGAFGPLPVFP